MDFRLLTLILSFIGSTTANAQIISSVSTAGDTLSIPLYGVALSIKIEPDSLVADGNQTCSVEVTVKESGSNTPLTGRSVTFAFSPGTFATITAQSNTDSRGIATATLSADTTVSLTGTVTGRLGSDPAEDLFPRGNYRHVEQSCCSDHAPENALGRTVHCQPGLQQEPNR